MDASHVVGTPDAVRDQLHDARGAHRANELMLTTVVHGHAERRRSYALVADAMQLTPTRIDVLTA